MSYPNLKKQAGFTLIEVLVASVILFSSIAIVGVIYKGVIIATVKSEKQVHIASVVPESIKKIQKELRSQKNQQATESQGSLSLLDVNAKWHAALVKSKLPPEAYDPDSGKMTQIDKKYYFWKVNVQFEFKNTVQEYNFNEFTWDE
ncbi:MULTISPECIES: prepilin-type N-terminal cleavage/methylation domain-containing protein [unclassified Pseudoalteromonas]|uniref:type IV pilus modification PilV family protein n=1 Tax=unclassified Pseudoalteromonas TaxID=194690 RepID=UPI003867567A